MAGTRHCPCSRVRFPILQLLKLRDSGYYPWIHGKFLWKGEGKWSRPGLRSYRSYGSEAVGWPYEQARRPPHRFRPTPLVEACPWRKSLSRKIALTRIKFYGRKLQVKVFPAFGQMQGCADFMRLSVVHLLWQLSQNIVSIATDYCDNWHGLSRQLSQKIGR